MSPDLAIVIVTYNSEPYIEACLRSVDAIEETEVEVVVFDNASTDQTVEVAKPWNSTSVTIVAGEENLGFGQAVNRSVEMTTAPYVLLLNPDAELMPGSAEGLLALARSKPENGLYGGLTRQSDGSLNEHTLRKLPSLLGTLMFGFGLSAVHPRLAVERLELPTELSAAPMVTASLLMIDRKVWDQLGGFDDRFFMYSEDADLCRRAVDSGHVPLVDPDIIVKHDGGASTPDTGRKIAMMMAGRATYIRLHWKGPAQALALGSLWCGVGLRSLVDRVRGQNAWATAWSQRRHWIAGTQPPE